MDTPEDAEREEGYSALVEEISNEAVEEFTTEKLRSYYQAHPCLAVDAIAAYEEAEKIRKESPSAALVLYTAAIEVGLKVTILKPVIYGLVHNDSVADLISDMTVKQSGFDRIKDLLAAVLAQYGGIDLANFKISGHSKTIWQEMADIQSTRNEVVHKSKLATPDKAVVAREVAVMILGGWLPKVLDTLGFEIKQGFLIGRA